MGLLNQFFWTNKTVQDLAMGNALQQRVTSRGVVSPWADPQAVRRIVIDDLYGFQTDTVTRTEAIQVPAIARARHLICETLARQPLKAFKGLSGEELPEQPTWLYRTDTGIGPRTQIMWALDDLLFTGFALFLTERGSENQLLSIGRVMPSRWRFTDMQTVEVDMTGTGQWLPIRSDQAILVEGGMEGLLTSAQRTIRQSRMLEDTVLKRMKNPIPTTELRYVGENAPIDPDEMARVRDFYIEARNDPDGTVMVTPGDWEVHAFGSDSTDLFIEGRNAVAIDIARHTGIPAIMLDASNINATSVNYTNTDSARNSYIDLTLRNWALPLEDRLSQDDVVPRGTYVQFDLSNLTSPDTGTGPVVPD